MYDMYPDYGGQEWGPAQHRNEEWSAKQENVRAMRVAFDQRDDAFEGVEDN